MEVKKKKMKMVLIIIGIVASVLTFSSFATPKQETKEECSQLAVNLPHRVICYQGKAYAMIDEADPQVIDVEVYYWETMEDDLRVYINNYQPKDYEVSETHFPDGKKGYWIRYNGYLYLTGPVDI